MNEIISRGNISMMTIEEKKEFYNAIASPDEKLSDFINKTIVITNVFVSPVEMTDQNTGETVILPRIVIIDASGVSYGCISKGIYTAINNIIEIFGEPSPATPITVEIKQMNGRNGYSFLTMKVI